MHLGARLAEMAHQFGGFIGGNTSGNTQENTFVVKPVNRNSVHRDDINC